MSHFVGLLLSVVLLRTAAYLLKMEIAAYYDHVALLIVVGGTLCAAFITYPIKELYKTFRAYMRIALRPPDSRSELAKSLIQLAAISGRSSNSLLQHMEKAKLNPFLRDGLELILAGFSRDDVYSIMRERINRDREREEAFGQILRTLSKYPPAFGLVGTVLGLVHVMRTLASGAEAGKIGLEMALALVATLYGLILTNFVLVPMSEHILLKSFANLNNREMMLDGLLLIYDKRSPVVVQEALNSYLPPLQREDIIGVKGARDKAAV